MALEISYGAFSNTDRVDLAGDAPATDFAYAGPDQFKRTQSGETNFSTSLWGVATETVADQTTAYGEIELMEEAVANPWQYAGGYNDGATGLNKFGVRYQDSSLGRWTTQDPLRQVLLPVDASRYTYASNNPINVTDPDGLAWDWTYADYVVAVAGWVCVGTTIAAPFTAGSTAAIAITACDYTVAVYGASRAASEVIG